MTSASTSKTHARAVKIGYSQVQSFLTQGRLPRGTFHLGVIEPSSQKSQRHHSEKPEEKCAAENRAYISGVFARMDISKYRGQACQNGKRNEERHERHAHDNRIDQIRNHAKPESRVLHSSLRVH